MKFIRRTAVVFSLLVTGAAVPALAQDDLNDLLEGNVEDGKKLIGAYVSPFMKSVTLGLNSGWYNTAKPHKIVGIDLTVTVSAMTIPGKELFYNPAEVQSTVRLESNSPDAPNAPTIFGPDRTPKFSYVDNTGVRKYFDGPQGLDLKGNVGNNWMPVPMVHLGVGLPKNTDLKIRFAPTIDVDGGELKLFGLGVMHDVKQYIPGLKLLPFDLSAFVGYTHLSLNYKYDDVQFNTPSGYKTENARGEMNMNATTIQGVVSKKMSVLTVYGGLGYNIAKSNLNMLGKYDVNSDGTYQANEIDPIKLGFAASGPRVTAGFRLKLAVITLHADYTLQKYNALTVGFGINVR
jgi:hypothetical protein